MAIKFDLPTSDELLESIENLEQRLTVCSVAYQYKQNTLFIRIPATFPEYSELIPGQTIYFTDLNNKIYLSLIEPKIKSVITRKLQWYGNQGPYTYYKIPIPIQLRKKYKLDKYTKLELIKENEQYLCVFL